MPLRWLEATNIPGTGGKACQRVCRITFMCILCVCTVGMKAMKAILSENMSPVVCVRSCARFHVS